MPSPNHACREKLSLLNECVFELSGHNENVRKHANYLFAGLDGDGLVLLKRRANQSKSRFITARQRHSDHVAAHGC
jgi:hypothetical protein